MSANKFVWAVIQEGGRIPYVIAGFTGPRGRVSAVAYRKFYYEQTGEKSYIRRIPLYRGFDYDNDKLY